MAREPVHRAVEYALASGRGEISLEVKTDNRAAVELYEKEGFTVSGVRQGYYEDGAGAFGMVLKQD